MTQFDQAAEAAQFIRGQVPAVPDVAVVLGSGLGALAGRLEAPAALPYEHIPHWPPSRVVGHAGTLVVGGVSGRTVAALSGRAHFYEGHSLDCVDVPHARHGPARRPDPRPDQRRRGHQSGLLAGRP